MQAGDFRSFLLRNRRRDLLIQNVKKNTQNINKEMFRINNKKTISIQLWNCNLKDLEKYSAFKTLCPSITRVPLLSWQ